MREKGSLGKRDREKRQRKRKENEIRKQSKEKGRKGSSKGEKEKRKKVKEDRRKRGREDGREIWGIEKGRGKAERWRRPRCAFPGCLRVIRFPELKLLTLSAGDH